MTISQLPPVPVRSQTQAAFAATTSTFLTALPTFVNEVNATALEVDANAASALANKNAAASSATNAMTSAAVASGAANYRGDYVATTTYSAGQSVTFNGLVWIAKQTTTNNTPTENEFWFRLKVTGTPVGLYSYWTAGVAAPQDHVDVLAAGTVDGDEYPLLATVLPTTNNTTTLATVSNPDGAAASKFGQSVATSGLFAIVGAPDAANGGKVYFYSRSGDTWTLAQTVNNPTPATGDGFGWSVAIEGNYAVVGAYLDDDTGTNSGRAYIYFYNGTTWTLQQALENPTPAAEDMFGYAVSIAAEYVIVSALKDSLAATQAGVAHIYFRQGTTWSLQATLSPGDGAFTPGALDEFGYAVALTSSYAAVGIPNRDDQRTNYGVVYMYERNGTQWVFKQKLLANLATRTAEDRFGTTLAIDGDRLLVGAPLRNGPSGQTDRGLVELWRRESGTWVSKANIAGTVNGDMLGSAIEITNTKVIAANTGALFIYSLTGTGTTLTLRTSIVIPAASSLSLQDDYLIVGTPTANTNAGQVRFIKLAINKVAVNPLPSSANHKTIIKVA